MTGRAALSVREGVCARASGPRGLVLLGRAQASASAGECEHAWVGRACGWAEPEEKRRSGPYCRFCFFFFKNVNSGSFCLFQ
jgi:hypothetical protein